MTETAVTFRTIPDSQDRPRPKRAHPSLDLPGFLCGPDFEDVIARLLFAVVRYEETALYMFDGNLRTTKKYQVCGLPHFLQNTAPLGIEAPQ
jgi:hypothetical protein